jgi:translation initiation factor IF-3
VPVPRRFDRRPPERDSTRINERIRVPEVRVIGEDGDQIGVMRTDEALRYAQERDLDLVEVAPEARPPVCRILDYSKYKYEQAQKQKAARKHQTQITIREIKFRPKIAAQDYETKKRHVERFLRHKDKVKITIMFRGREVTHPERGQMILDRLAEELTDLAVIEQRPNLDGRNMTMLLGPSKAVLAGTLGEEDGDGASAEAAPGNGAGNGELRSESANREAAASAPEAASEAAPSSEPATEAASGPEPATNEPEPPSNEPEPPSNEPEPAAGEPESPSNEPEPAAGEPEPPSSEPESPAA